MKKLIKLLIFTTSLFLISSCDYVELRDVSFVTGMTIDKSEIGIEVNYEIIYSTDETARDYAIYGTTGKTFLDSVVNISKITSGVLDYNHNKIIIISEELAREGIEYIIDALYKNSIFKNNILLLVSKDCLAKDILYTKPLTEKSLSNEIYLALDKSNLNYPKSRKVTLHDFYNFGHSTKISQVLPSITLETIDEKEIVSLEGLGLFKKGVLTDYISGEETQHLGLIEASLKGSAIIVDYKGKNLGICIVNNSAKKNYNEKNNSFTFTIDLVVSFKDFYSDQIDRLDALNGIDKDLKLKITNLYNKFLYLDIYNVNDFIYKNHYNTYKKITDFDNFISNLNTNFVVNSKLHDQGATTYE